MHSHSSTPSLALAGPDHECNLVMCGALPHSGITSPLALVGASASEALDYSEVCPSPSDSDSDSDDEYDVNADDYCMTAVPLSSRSQSSTGMRKRRMVTSSASTDGLSRASMRR